MTKTTVHGADRRRACRYAVARSEASLGWWVDSQFVTTPARLINISLNGCLVEIDRSCVLAEGQPIWVHPQVASSPDWIEGRIILIRKPMLGKGKLSVLFHSPIGYDLFKTLVYGPHHWREAATRTVPEHEWDQFWR